MPKFGIKYVWNQHPWICLAAKFYKKKQQKKHKFGTKNALFGYFWTRTLKKLFEISTLEFVKNESLTQTKQWILV